MSKRSFFRATFSAVGFFFLFFLSGLASLEAASEKITESFKISRFDDGLLVSFNEPVAVDRVSVPVFHSELWGAERIGRSVIVSTANDSGIAVRVGDDTFIGLYLNEPSTEWIRIVPVVSSPGRMLDPGDIAIEFVRADRRKMELELKDLLEQELLFQQRHNCFSCHRALPLAMALSAGSRNGLSIPADAVASMGRSITAFQSKNGSFSFPSSPEYGVVTPTLCGSMILSRLLRFDPALGPPLVRAVRSLLDWQTPDGTIVLDFNFPPLMVDSAFAAWSMLVSLSAARKVLERYGFPLETRFSWAWQRGISWFAEPWIKGYGKELFKILSFHEIFGTAVEMEIQKRDLRLKALELNPNRDPELRALVESLLVTLPGEREALHDWPFSAKTAPSFKHRAWLAFREILRFPD